MFEQTHDEQEIIQRVAALDIGKAELVCCVRVPDPKGGSRRLEEVKTYHDDPLAAVDGGPVAGSGGHPGSDGGYVRLLALPVLLVGGTRVSDCWRHTGFGRGWSTPWTSSTYLVGPKRIG